MTSPGAVSVALLHCMLRWLGLGVGCKRRLRRVWQWITGNVDNEAVVRWRRLTRSLLHGLKVRRHWHWEGEYLKRFSLLKLKTK